MDFADTVLDGFWPSGRSGRLAQRATDRCAWTRWRPWGRLGRSMPHSASGLFRRIATIPFPARRIWRWTSESPRDKLCTHDTRIALVPEVTAGHARTVRLRGRYRSRVAVGGGGGGA